MKSRKDFVTNSSSSSFIIARKQGCTLLDVESTFWENEENILQFLKDCGDDYNWDAYLEDGFSKESITALKDGKYQEALNSVIKYLATELFTYSLCDELDSWEIASEEFSNETDEIFSDFIYNYGYCINGNNVRII